MPEQKSFVEALIAFQSEGLKLKKDSVNPHFKNKYISLDALTAAVTPALCKHGLVWSAFPARDEAGRPTLHYQLAHVGGEVLSGTMPLLLAREDSQGLGSALTYARRYAMCAVLNIVADEDDDGNATSRAESAPKPRAVPKQALTAKELQGLRSLYKESGWSVDDLKMHLTAVGVQDVSDPAQAMRELTLEQAHNLNVELFKAVTKATEEAA